MVDQVNDESTLDKDSSVHLIYHDPTWSRVTDPDADHAKGTNPWFSYKWPSWPGAQACFCEYYNEQPIDQRGNENCVELTPAVSQLNYIIYTHISW